MGDSGVLGALSISSGDYFMSTSQQWKDRGRQVAMASFPKEERCKGLIETCWARYLEPRFYSESSFSEVTLLPVQCINTLLICLFVCLFI